MKAEIAAHKALDQAGIPNSRILHSNPSLFVEKEFVDGETLAQMSGNWRNYTTAEKNERLYSPSIFYDQIANSGKHITDLHWGNIMDEKGIKARKVVDPGSVQLGNGKLGVDTFRKNIELYSKPMGDAFTMARVKGFTNWLGFYLALQDSFDELRSRRSSAAIDAVYGKMATNVSEGPPLYRALVSEVNQYVQALSQNRVGLSDYARARCVATWLIR